MKWITSIKVKNFKSPVLYYIIGIILNVSLCFSALMLFNDIKANEQKINNNLSNYKIEFKKIYNYAKIKVPRNSYSTIKKNLEMFLKINNKKWSRYTKKKVVLTLQKGEMEFDIDHRDILGLISIESDFNIKAINYNKNGTKDYGLCQINGPNFKYLNAISTKVLKKHDIKFTYKKYDPALNIMNCFSYLNWSKSVLKSRRVYSRMKLIQSYNTGINGCISSNSNYIKIRRRYYSKFLREKKRIRF